MSREKIFPQLGVVAENVSQSDDVLSEIADIARTKKTAHPKDEYFAAAISSTVHLPPNKIAVLTFREPAYK